MIEAARTRADHEALAEQYDAEAESALALADKHERMAGLYKGIELSAKGPKFVAHCERLIAGYRSAAEDNRQLAQLHRELAAQLKD
ncbi:MAG: hypothetical protein HYY36_05730 [Gammaproteobacteria bacterium]|nr:hypothetical protein [Gammaproteobacteria bacterium]